MPWHCCLTTKRSQFLAANEIWLNLRCETFLPYTIEKVRHARRVREAKRPLYGRYLFVDCQPEDWGDISRQRGFDRWLTLDGRPEAVPDGTIAPEIALGELRVVDSPKRTALTSGATCRVLGGTYQGQDVEVALDSGNKIAVWIMQFNRRLRVTLPESALIASP